MRSVNGMALFEPDKAQRIRAMFARIVPHYDTVNRMMTLGLDRHWRKVAVAMARVEGARVLDVATGTADLALEAAKAGAREVVGVDFCHAMLEAAATKINALRQPIVLMAADALSLPFGDDTFDCVLNAFVLRNLVDIPKAFREFHRVLRPGGRLVCLDLTHPPKLLKPLINFYVDTVVPLIGNAVSGDLAAYRYLADSLKPHPDTRALRDLLYAARFVGVEFRLLGLGAVAVHRAYKPSSKSRPR